MILLAQRYSDPRREHEFARVEFLNRSCSEIDHIEHVDGNERRWSWGDLYGLACEKFHGKLVVIANSDIAFDLASGLRCKEGHLVALTRWDDESGPRFVGHQCDERWFSGSQDAWAFVAGSLPRPDIDIPMGWVGMDQLVVGWAVRHGVPVSDPCLSVRTRHIHADNRREDRHVAYGYYGYPQATTLEGVTGNVICHQWPSSQGGAEYDWEFRCQR